MFGRTTVLSILITFAVAIAGCTSPDPASDEGGDGDAGPERTPGPAKGGSEGSDPPATVNETVGTFRLIFRGGNQTFTIPNGTLLVRAQAYANVSGDGAYVMDNPGFTYGPNVAVRSFTQTVTEDPNLHFIFDRDAGVGAAGNTVQGPLDHEEEDPPHGGWDVFMMGGVGQNIQFDVTVSIERLAEANQTVPAR